MIRESKVHQIYSTIQTGQREGMKTMNQSLLELYREDLITLEDAISHSLDTTELVKLMDED